MVRLAPALEYRGGSATDGRSQARSSMDEGPEMGKPGKRRTEDESTDKYSSNPTTPGCA